MDIVRLDARTDFRLEKLAGMPVWYVPADAAADGRARRRLASARRRKRRSRPGARSRGRSVHVPRAAMGVARFTFHELCEQPLAAADYLRIAHEYHTIILDHIPQMSFDTRNAAKRFIILIDTLYDRNVKLIASADSRARRALSCRRGLRGRRVQAHRVAADRDALAELSGAAARRRARENHAARRPVSLKHERLSRRSW